MVTHEVLSRPQTRRRNSREAVLATACCGVFFSFASIVVFTFGIFLKPLTAAFQWSRAEVSLAFALAALAVAGCSPFLGYLLDRYPARRVILPCTIVYGGAFASLSLLTPHLWHLYAIFILLGVVGNGTTQLGYARVVSSWFDANRGQALAAVMAGSGLGSMVFPPVAQALISRWGWRSAYAVMGAAILAVSLPLATLFLHEPRNTVKAKKSTRTGSAGASLRSVPFLAIAAALLLFSFATNGLNTHWAALLADRGASPERAAFVLSAAGLATLCSKLGSGYLLDRFRANRVAAVLFGICAMGFALVLVPYSWPMALTSAVLIGIGMGVESDAVPYLLTRYFGLEHFGSLYAYTWVVYAVAGASGPIVMGAVFDRSGSYTPVLVAGMAMVIGACAIFALLPPYSLGPRP